MDGSLPQISLFADIVSRELSVLWRNQQIVVVRPDRANAVWTNLGFSDHFMTTQVQGHYSPTHVSTDNGVNTPVAAFHWLLFLPSLAQVNSVYVDHPRYSHAGHPALHHVCGLGVDGVSGEAESAVPEWEVSSHTGRQNAVVVSVVVQELSHRYPLLMRLAAEVNLHQGSGVPQLHASVGVTRHCEQAVRRDVHGGSLFAYVLRKGADGSRFGVIRTRGVVYVKVEVFIQISLGHIVFVQLLVLLFDQLILVAFISAVLYFLGEVVNLYWSVPGGCPHLILSQRMHFDRANFFGVASEVSCWRPHVVADNSLLPFQTDFTILYWKFVLFLIVYRHVVSLT